MKTLLLHGLVAIAGFRKLAISITNNQSIFVMKREFAFQANVQVLAIKLFDNKRTSIRQEKYFRIFDKACLKKIHLKHSTLHVEILLIVILIN